MVYSFILWICGVYTILLYLINPLNIFSLRLVIVIEFILVEFCYILVTWFKSMNSMSAEYNKYRIVGIIKV